MLYGMGGLFDGEHLKDVPHILPFLHPAYHPGGGHFLPQHGGVGIENLVGAYLHQRGREVGEVPIQRGKLRIGDVCIPGIGTAEWI